MYLSLPVYVFVLSLKILFVNGKYDLHWDFTAATNPYITLTGDNKFCKSECDKDVLCNGYSIDNSNNGCFLSRCTTPTSVPTCPTCYSASKNPASSTEVCPPGSTMPTPKVSSADTMASTETVTFTEINPTTLTSTMSSVKPVTNDVTQIFINNANCNCVCVKANQTLQESIEKRRTKLTVNKPELSSSIRKLYSVPDHRTSSKVIGSVAVVTFVVFGMLLVIADLSSLLSLYSKRKSKNET